MVTYLHLIARPLALALLASAFLLGADEPFVDGKLEIRHDGDKRELVFTARNVSGKDVKTMLIAYVLRDRDGNVAESDQVRCVGPQGTPVVPKDFAGVIWQVPIVQETVVGGSFGPQEVLFTDGTRWTAPTRRAPAEKPDQTGKP